MLDKLTSSMDVHTQALVLRSERQRMLASNIANADTPGYTATDINFADAMRSATEGAKAAGAGVTNARHIAMKLPLAAGVGGAESGFVAQTQPRLDGNSVDLDRERAAFADNAVRYEATLRFINGQNKTMLAAITGQ